MGKRNKGTSKPWSLDFHEAEKWVEKFNMNNLDVKPAIENALTYTHKYITKNITMHMQNQYLPSKKKPGMYSSGDTEKTIYKDCRIMWSGDKNAYVWVGFDHSKGGASIFLMYGTPKMNPSAYLYDDIFGRKTRSNVRLIQLDEFEQMFGEMMEGKG